MIKEFTVHPKPANKNARIAFLVAILISALGFVAYFSVDRYKGIVGMAALMMLTTAILFYTKYISPEFFYDITTDSEGTPIFVVRQLIGKRQSTLCRVDLADIVSVVKQTAEERKAHKTARGYTAYVYTPTLMPEITYLLTVTSRYEKTEIRIEGTDELAELLLNYAKEASAMRDIDEE